MHDGKATTYSFMFERVKTVLFSTKEIGQLKTTEESTNLLTFTKIEEEIRDSKVVYAMIRKEVRDEVAIFRSCSTTSDGVQ